MKNCYFYWFSLINCATNSAHNLCLYRTTPKSTKVQQSFHLFPALFSLLLPPSFCAVACALFPSLLSPCPVDFCQFICWLTAVADVPCLYFKNVSAPQREKRRQRDRAAFSTCLLFLLISALPRPAVQHRVDNYRWNDFIRLSATGPRCRQSR